MANVICVDRGVIKICTYGSGTSTGGTSQTQPNNGNQNTQPTNGGTNQTQPVNGGNNQTQPANGNGQTTTNGGVTQIINNNGTIINISNASVYLYNIYYNSNTVTNTQQNTNNTQQPTQSVTVVTPNYVPQQVVNQNNFVADFARFVGGIKQNNPIQYAVAKINFNKAYVDNLIQALQNRLNHIHVYERRNGNNYQYSVCLLYTSPSPRD
jgi:hypothetical protein